MLQQYLDGPFRARRDRDESGQSKKRRMQLKAMELLNTSQKDCFESMLKVRRTMVSKHLDMFAVGQAYIY